MNKETKRGASQFIARLKGLGKESAANAALATSAFLAIIMTAMAAVTFWETSASLTPTYFYSAAVRSAVVIEPHSIAQLESVFHNEVFELAPVQEGRKKAPRIILIKIPDDLPTLEPPGKRIEIFIKILLPSVLLANEELDRTRARIIRLKRRRTLNLSLNINQQKWLVSIAKKFVVGQIEPFDEDIFFDKLLERVDIIPVELALAQGGIESGWGSSRVALEGNAIFGQRVWKRGKEVSAGADVDILYQAYDDILDATRSYALNLNTHKAYSGFRKRRREMRNTEKPLDAASLAGQLLRYSERGQDYVDQIRSVIAVNKLTDFNQAELAPN